MERRDPILAGVTILGNGNTAVDSNALFIEKDTYLRINTYDSYKSLMPAVGKSAACDITPFYIIEKRTGKTHLFSNFLDDTEAKVDYIIVQNLKKALSENEFISKNYEILQLKNLGDTTEDETGYIIQFKLKPNVTNYEWIIKPCYEEHFHIFSDSPLIRNQYPFNDIAIQWEWEVLLGVDDFSYSDLDTTVDSYFRFIFLDKPTKSEYTFRGSISSDDANLEGFIFIQQRQDLYPYDDGDDAPTIASKVANSLNNHRFIKDNFSILYPHPEMISGEFPRNSVLGRKILFFSKKNPAYYDIKLIPSPSFIFSINKPQQPWIKQSNNPFEYNGGILIYNNCTGNIIKPYIANITEPASVSQSELANFVQFEAVKESTVNNEKIKFTINTAFDINDEKMEETSKITFSNDNDKYAFYGTKDKRKVSNTVFFIDENANSTGQNLRQCLLQNSFLASNYKIEVNFSDNTFNNIITIQPLDSRNSQPLTASKTEGSLFFNITHASISASGNDSIFNQSDSAAIELEIYTLEKDEAFLGVNKLPENSMGSYMTTLSKSYFGEPLWFNLNALMNNKSSFSNDFLRANDWSDAGTANAYRFIARRFDGKNREPFYISEVLYNITGYDRTLEKNDLSAYVLKLQYDQEGNLIIPTTAMQSLTKQPTLTHIKGQTQYFNFILSDEKHDEESNIQLGLQYKFFTQSGVEIGSTEMHLKRKKNFHVVNTIKLDIDEAIDKISTKKKIGRAEVSLIIKQGQTINIASQPLQFKILPTCLYESKVKNFAFLNSLGGWSAFSFGGDNKSDFKATSETIFKTHTPQMGVNSDIESVFSKEVKETFTVESLPVSRQTAEWLKEMSASPAIYELNDTPDKSRYIIVEDMKINPNSKDQLFTIEMKYRYSDSYNAR